MLGIVYPAGKALGTVCMLGLALVPNCESTVNFDDLKTGTPVGTHYRDVVPLGLEFVGEQDCPLPRVAAADRASSRPNVANIHYAGGVFPWSCARARLNQPAVRVKISVASNGLQRDGHTVSLYARNVDGKVVAQAQATVWGGADSSTPLEVRTPDAVITSFSLQALGADLWIDDVKFEQPVDEPAYR